MVRYRFDLASNLARLFSALNGLPTPLCRAKRVWRDVAMTTLAVNSCSSQHEFYDKQSDRDQRSSRHGKCPYRSHCCGRYLCTVLIETSARLAITVGVLPSFQPFWMIFCCFLEIEFLRPISAGR